MNTKLNPDELVSLKKVLRDRHIKVSARKIEEYLDIIAGSCQLSPMVDQLALIIQLLDNYETTQKKEVIILDESNRTEMPVTLHLGVLAADWPGMSNSILGIVHHRKQNVTFIQGITFNYKHISLGILIQSFQLNTRHEYDRFMEDKKELIAEIKDAAQGSAEKFILLDDEAVKSEIYTKLMKRVRELHPSREVMKELEDNKEALKFISARSREYLEERNLKDLANLVITNIASQNAIRRGETQQVIRIKNFETKYEELTGITFVCKEDFFSIEDFLKTLDHLVPGNVIKHHKSYITQDGILVYRIEIVDRNLRPLDSKIIRRLEATMGKLINISSSDQLPKLKSVGGFEHYARAIIPFLSEELKKTRLTQVFINVDSKTEFLINIKLIIVSFKSRKKRIYSLLSRLSLTPGIDIASSIPPKLHSNRIEIHILKLKVSISEFRSIQEVYDTIKEIVKNIYGEIRDFDEGFRNIYIKILNQLLEQLKDVDAALIGEIFFNIDELYKIEIAPNFLTEIIRVCAATVEETRYATSDQLLFKYKQIPDSNRTVVVISYSTQKRILSRLAQNLKDVDAYFTKIEWRNRSYLILILSRGNSILPKDLVEEIMLKCLPGGSQESKPDEECK
ncbi:MAG: hypothetical protein ACM3SY_15285 [Candidatus Omnitrophota bacterium]